MPNIVLCYPIQERQLEWIRRALPAEWQIINAGQDGIAEAILEADVFCGHAKVPVPWKTVVKNGRLKWIQSSAAGLDHCLTPEVVHSSISLPAICMANRLESSDLEETAEESRNCSRL